MCIRDRTEYEALSGARYISSYSSSGNWPTGTPGSFTGTAYPSAAANIGLRLLGGARGLTFLTCGDSTFQGSYTTISQNCFGRQAAALLSTPATPVSFVNCGYSGQQHAAIYTNALNHAAVYKPDVIVFETLSPNDLFTQASSDASLGRTVQFLDYCYSNTIVPILTTALPWNGVSGAQESVRIAHNAKVRAFAASGVLVADFDAAMTDGGSPAKLRSAFTVYPSNNIDAATAHPGDAGHAQMAATLAPALSKILAVRPY